VGCRAPYWRFIASVPLELPMLPFAVVLNVADPRMDVERPDDLLGRLEECAAIAADELRLIGDIALQSERLIVMHSEAALLIDTITRGAGPFPIMRSRAGG
jgi:hypothetical protein